LFGNSVVIRCLGLFFIVLLSYQQVWALESPSLPVHHGTYEILERLKTRGVFPTLLLGTKPLSRYSLSLPLVELLSRINEEEVPRVILEPGVQEDLHRLLLEFQEEVDLLEKEGTKRFYSYTIADPLSLELTYASFSRDGVRLRENHQGDFFREGFNKQLKLRSRGTIGNFLSWFISPKLTINGDGAVFRLEEGLIKLGFKNIELGFGRESLWWGPGYHGALLLSNNAPPLDLIRAGSRQPFRLPYFLKSLGSWQFTTFVAQLEEDRAVPHAKLIGVRIDYLPFPFLEFGASRITQWGGKGRPNIPFLDFLELYFSDPNMSGIFEVNELASVDVKIRLPSLPWIHGWEVYSEVGGEDEAGFFPQDLGYLVGLYLTGFLEQPTLDFRVEYANNHVSRKPNVWYNHGVYTSGYTHKGVVLGHHMGSDAESIFFQLSKEMSEEVSIRFSFDQERHFLSGPVKERKREFIVQVKSRLGWLKPFWIFTYEYEGIKNHNGIQGEKAKNHTISSRLEYIF